MRIISRIALALVVTCALVCAPVVASATPSLPSGSKPIPGAVITRFVLPEVSWGSGHRGVDLAGTPGEIVFAAADGTVTYAGVLAGRGVVVVDHGVVRTTYEPVAAMVAVGDVVSRGQPIGRLQAGHPTCPGTTCLHWGLRDGDAYLDPLLLLGPSIRLLPASASPVPQTATGAGFVGAATGMDLVIPATGPVTSPYGMRRHPITGGVEASRRYGLRRVVRQPDPSCGRGDRGVGDVVELVRQPAHHRSRHQGGRDGL